MLTDPKLRSQVDALWDKLWAGGLSNPMDAIEQFSYLLFFKRLDDAENRREKQAIRRNQVYEPKMPDQNPSGQRVTPRRAVPGRTDKQEPERRSSPEP